MATLIHKQKLFADHVSQPQWSRIALSAALYAMALCARDACAQDVDLQPFLEANVYALHGTFDGERWSAPERPIPDLPEELSPDIAEAIQRLARNSYRACQGGDLYSTLPFSSEYRVLIMISGTQRIIQDDGVTRFEAAASPPVQVEWVSDFADGEPERDQVFASGPGMFLLPMGEEDHALVSQNGVICGNHGSGGNCGSSGCGSLVVVNGRSYSTLGFEPFSTLEDGRWFLHLPSENDSSTAQRLEFIDGDLVEG